MLVLGRKIGESIRINDDIRLTIHEIRGDSVKIAFEASKDVRIWREEIWLKMQEERKEST